MTLWYMAPVYNFNGKTVSGVDVWIGNYVEYINMHVNPGPNFSQAILVKRVPFLTSMVISKDFLSFYLIPSDWLVSQPQQKR